MKKVIDGKTYNTDTAKLIVAKDSNLPHNDLDYWYEELYQTKDGDYFIYGEGGAASFFSRPRPSDWSGPGEDIFPISKEIAEDYIKDHDLILPEIARRLVYSYYNYDFNWER